MISKADLIFDSSIGGIWVRKKYLLKIRSQVHQGKDKSRWMVCIEKFANICVSFLSFFSSLSFLSQIFTEKYVPDSFLSPEDTLVNYSELKKKNPVIIDLTF